MSGIRALGTGVLLAPLLVASHAAWAQMTAPAKAGSAIYSCTDAQGKRLTSDRPIPECVAREQRVLNSDGSVRRVLPPTLTAAERAEAEARDVEAAAERVAKQDAVRRDRSLMSRYPNEAAHRRSRDAALEIVRSSMRISEERIKALTAERKPLQEETQFYAGKQIPAKLKSQIDANDAALAAQRSLMQDQEAEVGRIDGLYDAELARLKRLWAGAPPGSLDTPAASGGASIAAATPSAKPVNR
jgi:hypothetical protein